MKPLPSTTNNVPTVHEVGWAMREVDGCSAHQRLEGVCRASNALHALCVDGRNEISARQAAAAALDALSKAVVRALARPWDECHLTSDERTAVENASPYGLQLAAWCGFSSEELPHGGSSTADADGSVSMRRSIGRSPMRTASEVALLRALGATVERARVTPSEAACGPSAAGLRAPLMRRPPSHGGLASSVGVPLYSTHEALVDRAAAALLIEGEPKGEPLIAPTPADSWVDPAPRCYGYTSDRTSRLVELL